MVASFTHKGKKIGRPRCDILDKSKLKPYEIEDLERKFNFYFDLGRQWHYPGQLKNLISVAYEVEITLEEEKKFRRALLDRRAYRLKEEAIAKERKKKAEEIQRTAPIDVSKYL